MKLKLNIQNLDESKADARLRKTAEFVIPEFESDPISVEYTAIRVGEITKYMTLDEDGTPRMVNFRSIVKDKVKKIENLSIEDTGGKVKEIVTADDLLSLPPVMNLDLLVINIGSKIFSEARLTEDEAKN